MKSYHPYFALLASPHRLLTFSSQVPEDFFHVYRFNFGLFVSPDIMPYESKQAFWRLFNITLWHISKLVSESRSLSALQFLIRLFIMKLLVSNDLPPCFPSPLTFQHRVLHFLFLPTDTMLYWICELWLLVFSPTCQIYALKFQLLTPLYLAESNDASWRLLYLWILFSYVTFTEK